jgi:hypothetical protein
MDLSAKEIVFDENGVCNFCKQAQKSLEEVNAIPLNLKKTDGTYDCIIGLSGGVDSGMLLHYAVELGLKPLCFTVDTGYNKPEADENILKMVEKLKVPFYRYTINLENFKKMQTAFMRSGVRNIEIPTDHVLMAATYELASKYGIKTILSGGNVSTESIMPPSWGYNARDLTHIKAIYNGPFDGLPTCSIWKWNWYRWVKQISVYYLLDHYKTPYNRKKSEKFLIKEYGFKSTGEKHEENYFTVWFQNFYLFEKFGIDKRKAHYSSLINSGQMKRKEALALLTASPIYPEFGIEKKVMRYKRHQHEDYAMDKWYGIIAKIMRFMKNFIKFMDESERDGINAWGGLFFLGIMLIVGLITVFLPNVSA